MQQDFPCSPAQLANLASQLSSQGVTIPSGNSGTISGHGIQASFDYNGTDTLSVTIYSKPWYIPASQIFSTIQEHLNG